MAESPLRRQDFASDETWEKHCEDLHKKQLNEDLLQQKLNSQINISRVERKAKEDSNTALVVGIALVVICVIGFLFGGV